MPRKFKYIIPLLVVIDLIILSLIFFGRPKISLPQNIVSTFKNEPEIKQQKETQIILMGDIMLGRTVMITSLNLNDPTYPFKKVADLTRKADIVFANLENPIVSDCPLTSSGFKFCAETRMIEGLTFANINVVNLANNHSGNFGKEGINQSQNFLEDKKILVTGLGKLGIKEVNNTDFGFLGFDYVDNKPTIADLGTIKDADKKADVLIVAVHWGQEYTAHPNNLQKIWAKKFVENGADIVMGSHPHWVQDIDLVDGKPVYYSLGNFVFDQMWSEETKKGLAIRLTYDGSRIIKEEKLPIYIRNIGQPEWVSQ